jgi:hypothetical protein
MSEPLTPEEEAHIQTVYAGLAVEDAGPDELLIKSLLATLDAEREKWDGLSARAIEAEAAARVAPSDGLRDAAVTVLTAWARTESPEWGKRFAAALDALRAALATTGQREGLDPREVSLHPGQHEFTTVCRLCGDPGMLHVSVITPHERVSITDSREADR